MNEVFIVDGRRTPQVKAGGEIKDMPVPYLGTGLIRHLIEQTKISEDQIDEVIIGNTGAPAKFPNIARVIALEAGLDQKTSAYSVHRNCASGLEALSQAFDKISLGRADVVLAGGVESMSQFPLIYSKEMTEFFFELMKAKSMSDKIKAVTNFRLPYLSPVIAIEQGLTDPFCGLNMGQTAELLAREFEIDREAQDAYAVESHRKTILAGKEGKWSQEIVPLHFGRGLAQYLEKDIGPRDDSSMEKLAKLKPYFEKKSGTVTVGNSCPITDGGSMLLLCSKKAVEKYQLNPIAKMTNYHFHGLSPKRMGMGPLLAMDGVLKRSQLNLSQMDLIEINEAFAAQVLSIIKVAKDKTLCEKFGMGQVLGEINSQILNVNGGAIALGHPVGSSGSRIVVTLMHELKRRRLKKGLASLCIGGGQGGACIIEMV